MHEWPIFGQYCARTARHFGTSRVWPNHEYDDYRGWQNKLSVPHHSQLKIDPYPTWKLYILNCPNGEPIAWMAQIWPILCAPHCGTSRVWPNHDYDDYRGWQNHVACQIAYEWMGCQAKCVQHIDICNCFFRVQSRFDFPSKTFSFIQIGTGCDKTCRQFFLGFWYT